MAHDVMLECKTKEPDLHAPHLMPWVEKVCFTLHFG